jgi:hypothetical protein
MSENTLELRSLSADADNADRWKREIAAIIQQRAVSTLFQPLVDARARRVFGYAALLRGPSKAFRDAAERAKLKPLGWHDLRHRWAGARADAIFPHKNRHTKNQQETLISLDIVARVRLELTTSAL